MAVVGCYSMDLYCDTGGDPYGGDCPYRPYKGAQGQFTGRTERECLKTARSDGWTFREDATLAYCPKCSKLKTKR
ncbi:hypothetical protein EV128_12220 [Rhizobium azibense]|nr:hypothetical protein EV128_12220 [Rhizobium azibense]